jgi:hypothetical protein
MHSSRSHDAAIRVYDAAGNVIETHDHTACFATIRQRSNGNAGETNRTQDAWRVEALRDLRAGLGTPLAAERERSGGKDCAICNAIWIPSEVL